jgi:hypothetical protein
VLCVTLQATTGLSAASGDWFVAQLPRLPHSCYEVNCVFSDEAGSTYDNAAGADFYVPVRQPEPVQVGATAVCIVMAAHSAIFCCSAGPCHVRSSHMWLTADAERKHLDIYPYMHASTLAEFLVECL